MADYNETLLGDLSNSQLNPTKLSLSSGSNVITGTTSGASGTATDPDFFTFTVPAGASVSSVKLNAYQWGSGDQSSLGYGDSYFAITAGSFFADITNASTYLVSKLIDNLSAEGSEVGLNLLSPEVGTAVGPAGSGSLGPGVYTVWYQETAANTSYQFDIVLDVPQPTITQATRSRDLLTGTPNSSDTFRWRKLSYSLLKRYDTITNYEDQDRLRVTGSRYRSSLESSEGRIRSLSARRINDVLGGRKFSAGDAAAFQVRGERGTFIALNDDRRGFQADRDALIFLEGYRIGASNPVTVV